MADFTLAIRDEHLAMLQRLLDQHNANNGSDMTLPDFILMILKNICLQEEINVFLQDYDQKAPIAKQMAIERFLEKRRGEL
jgi:hypothetical protein